MKIAFIAGRDMRKRDDTDGATVLIHHFATYLASRGHTVTIYTPAQYWGGSYRKEATTQTINSNHLPAGVKFEEFNVHELANLAATDDPAQYFLNRILISTKEAEFFSDGKLFEYDAVYLFHIAHAFGLTTKKLLPLEKTILFPMMLGSFYRKFMSVPDMYLAHEREALRHILHISSPSSMEMAVLRDEYHVDEQRIFKMHRGYDKGTFTSHIRSSIPREGSIHILCANSIRPQKGQHFFISLVEYALQRGCSLVIHLVGVNGGTHSSWYNAYSNMLMSEIDARKLQANFQVHQVATQKQLSAIMQSCHLAIYPSVTETFGKSALESVVSGLPTLVFNDVSAFAEYIVDHRTGIRVERNVASLYSAIEELFTHEDIYASISQNGAGLIENFTWSKVLDDATTIQSKRGFHNI